MMILDVKKSKAYQIIHKLREEVEAKGKMCPKAGKIQKTYFCEQFMLDVKDCDAELASKNKIRHLKAM